MGDKVMLMSGKPATISYQADIKIEEEYRDPVNIRKTDRFQSHFDTIWKLLGKES